MKRRGFTITELSVTIAVSTVLLLAIVALIVSSQSYSQFRTVDALLDDEMKAIESGVNSFINEIDTLGGFGAPVISGGGDVNAEITLEKKVGENATDEAKLTWDSGTGILSGYIEGTDPENGQEQIKIVEKTYATVKTNKLKSVTLSFANSAEDPNVIRCMIIASVDRNGKKSSESNQRYYTFIVVKRTTNPTETSSGGNTGN